MLNRAYRYSTRTTRTLLVLLCAMSSTAVANENGMTLHLGFEEEAELLADFVSQSANYAAMGQDSLAARQLEIAPARFGNGLHIRDGWPISKGTWNESGLDCDLLVAVIWGEWHKKPHYWGSDAFKGDRGSVAFWVSADTLHPGVVFMQGAIAWGRKERDLFTVEVDKEGRLNAHLRDIHSQYHRVTADNATWQEGVWQHIAVVYDRAYGMKLYSNGELVGSTWGEDAWWQTPRPGLFSFFLPESAYDELYYFDVPLEAEQINALYANNQPPAATPAVAALDTAAQKRLLETYGDLAALNMPTLEAGNTGLQMKQTEILACQDENIPSWWVLDGRYELAWPHPYRLFTFILGDADFHASKIDMTLAPGEAPNYIALEGTLGTLDIMTDSEASDSMVRLTEYPQAYYAQSIDLQGASSLHIPLDKAYGSPPGLEGSANIPLSGDTRIHEIQLWEVTSGPPSNAGLSWNLSPQGDASWQPRYAPALNTLMGSRSRTVIGATRHQPTPAQHVLEPLEATHLVSPGLQPDRAIDSIQLCLQLLPNKLQDHLWIKLRDPGNPSRIWAQTCIRVNYASLNIPQSVSVSLDIIDLMLASEDRLLIELTSAQGCTLHLGEPGTPSTLGILFSTDPAASLDSYIQHELRPCIAQYMKEYNYTPWTFTGEDIDIRNWNHFGGPYDMIYPPLAVLRHAPDHYEARMYRTQLLERDRSGLPDTDAVRTPLQVDAPANAPAWAIWERELLRKSREVTHWIASQQREDGMFWGGANDDSFIPLGWAAMPLLGDETTRKAWLRFYEGLEEQGIFHDGYCDIWPIDPLHITDFITSRGLMLAYALGDPFVFERELRTTERYAEQVSTTNQRLAQQGKPLLTGNFEDRKREDITLVEQMEAEILDYSRTHVEWYWGIDPDLPPHTLQDRDAFAQRLMELAYHYDEAAIFAMTEARVHTDNQTGIARNEIISAALGGRLQGRVEPYPHGIAVSWEQADTADLARLVSYADAAALSVHLYNFQTTPMEIGMRVWRLDTGRYHITMGPNTNDDGVMDEGAATLYSDERDLQRFSLLPLTIPARQPILLTLTQLSRSEYPEAVPDLAVSHRDIQVNNEGTVDVTIHNIGSADAKHVEVTFHDEHGTRFKTETIASLNTPKTDYAAHRHTLTIDHAGVSEIHVHLDPDNRIDEILEENNTAMLVLPAQDH